MANHQYGRGKFEAHANYINYMSEIVAHKHYHGMPNAVSGDGRINWQVSSGKTTSFYKDYLARRAWWEQTANKLGIPENAGDRFTIAARRIHPSGYRPCRLCGKQVNVGYFYVNSLFARAVAKEFPGLDVAKQQSIAELLPSLAKASTPRAQAFLEERFPERRPYFHKFGYSAQAFERARHLRTRWLSPGYMGNPPDRLDGFHDYCLYCRKESDPGRSDENMRTYNHDRRSFEWWAEGDWFVADALYNAAGPGRCLVLGCGQAVDKVSPDHVGPLACGFRQLPLFTATCPSHNSAKNRRFTRQDVATLIANEKTTGESVASWQVRAHWDKYKNVVANDNETKALSNSLRSLQDMYFRVLWQLYQAGYARLLATFLNPQYAFRDIKFVGLDSATLRFEGIRATEKKSKLRNQLAARIISISFESLAEYVRKMPDARKMVRDDYVENKKRIDQALARVDALERSKLDAAWADALDLRRDRDARAVKISDLLAGGMVPRVGPDEASKSILASLFDAIGRDAEIDFTRYARESLVEEE